jgi:hypothetical protein
VATGSRDRTDRLGQRSAWLTAAAVIAFVGGCWSLLYVPLLIGGLPGASVIFLSFPVLSITAGVGLLRRLGWARFLAGALAGYELIVEATTLTRLVAEATVLPADLVIGLLDAGACLVVLFAVTRRWAPVSPRGSGARS